MVKEHHAIGSQSHSLFWCLRENWLDKQEHLGLSQAQSPMNEKPLDTWALRGAKEHQSLHLLQPHSPKEQFSRSLMPFWRNQLSGTWQVNRTLGFSKMPNQGNCLELLKPLAKIWIIRLIYKYWQGIPLPLLELNPTKPWISATCRDCSRKQSRGTCCYISCREVLDPTYIPDSALSLGSGNRVLPFIWGTRRQHFHQSQNIWEKRTYTNCICFKFPELSAVNSWSSVCFIFLPPLISDLSVFVCFLGFGSFNPTGFSTGSLLPDILPALVLASFIGAPAAISSSSFCFFELVFFKGFLVVGRLESFFLLTSRQI